MNDFDFGDAMAMGTGYALYRHGQDKQTQALLQALEGIGASGLKNLPPPTGQPIILDDEMLVDRRGDFPVPNAVERSTLVVPESWDDFIGQEKLKRQLLVHIAYAQQTGTSLPHVLLASGYPGVGKSTLARMIAGAMDSNIVELVPPFNVYTLAEAAESLTDCDVLFIDEIHGLANNGKKGAEILLKVLEDGVVYLPNGEIVELPDITVVGATTDRDMLPEPVIDRFRIKPYFEPYSEGEMQLITFEMGLRHDVAVLLMADDMELIPWLARAARRTPRLAEEIILGLRALAATFGGAVPTPGQVLDFVDIQYDGLGRVHVEYLTTLHQKFGRPTTSGMVEYIAGEETMRSILRETKQGISRVERFLLELGLIERTPRGRSLTPDGVQRAARLLEDSAPSSMLPEESR